VLFFLNIVSRLCVGPLLPVVEREFGLRHSGAGSLYFFLAAGSCVGLYLSGHVAWRLSHRATIAVSGMTLGAALVAIAFTPSLSASGQSCCFWASARACTFLRAWPC